MTEYNKYKIYILFICFDIYVETNYSRTAVAEFNITDSNLSVWGCCMPLLYGIEER